MRVMEVFWLVGMKDGSMLRCVFEGVKLLLFLVFKFWLDRDRW